MDPSLFTHHSHRASCSFCWLLHSSSAGMPWLAQLSMLPSLQPYFNKIELEYDWVLLIDRVG